MSGGRVACRISDISSLRAATESHDRGTLSSRSRSLVDAQPAEPSLRDADEATLPETLSKLAFRDARDVARLVARARALRAATPASFVALLRLTVRAAERVPRRLRVPPCERCVAAV